MKAKDLLYLLEEKKPKEILGIFDNGGETLDRYTIVFTKNFSSDMANPPELACLGLSENTNSLQGFSQWDTCVLSSVQKNNKEIKWKDLSKEIQNHIERIIKE
jgi:hypothetical protein